MGFDIEIRTCEKCRFHKEVDGKDRCTHYKSETIDTDYVTGQQTSVYPLCQDSREGKITNYCGNEGRNWEGK